MGKKQEIQFYKKQYFLTLYITLSKLNKLCLTFTSAKLTKTKLCIGSYPLKPFNAYRNQSNETPTLG